MSDNESDEVKGEEKEQRLPLFLLIILCMCCVLLIAGVIVALFLKGFFMSASSESPFSLLSLNERAETSFDDVLEICATKNRKLPVPKSLQEERMLIDNIKKFHETAKCDNYLIGYKLDKRVRYRSKDKRMKWPPLNANRSAAIPHSGRDCVEIKLKSDKKSLEISSSKPCNSLTEFTCLVGYALNGDYCKFRRLWCLYAVDVAGKNLKEKFESFKTNVKRHDKHAEPYGILLIDKNYLSVDVENLTFPVHEPCYAMEVNYVLDYKDIYSSESLPYNMNLVVRDPEMECVAVSSNNFTIETVPCTRNACALCE